MPIYSETLRKRRSIQSSSAPKRRVGRHTALMTDETKRLEVLARDSAKYLTGNAGKRRSI